MSSKKRLSVRGFFSQQKSGQGSNEGAAATPDVPTTAAVPSTVQIKRFGLSVLSPGNDPIVDIVAIHGLNGGPEKTWTANNGKLWLRDFLPEDVPNARILTWGYDANTHKFDQGPSQKFLYDHETQLLDALVRKRQIEQIERRPIIFIAHSLGGIVLKGVLLQSKATSEDRKESGLHQILISTYAIMFMGTPHSGSPAAPIGKAIANMVAITGHADDRLLKHLTEHSEYSQRQISQFSNISRDFKIYYVYETLKTRVKGTPKMIEVVPKHHATVSGDSRARELGIGANHSNLVKFTSKDSDGYCDVSEIIQLWMRDACNNIKERWEAEDVVIKGQAWLNIPFQLTDIHCTEHFVPREAEMQDIEQNLQPGQDFKKRRIYVLHGLGGIGKTQLAAQFARSHKDDYSAIFWLNGDNITTLTSSLAGQLLRLPEKDRISVPSDVVEQAKYFLALLGRAHSSRWLLIYDNVDREWRPSGQNDPQAYDLEAWLPNSDQGSILVTSRLREHAHFGSSQRLGAMDDEQGLQVLVRNAGREPSGEELDTAKKLVSTLAGLALALTQAGRYIFQVGVTFKTYHELYEQSWRDLAKRAPELRDYAGKSILTTWKISYDRIKEVNTDAANLLQLWAYLDRQDVWFELLSHDLDIQPPWFKNIAENRMKFLDSVQPLLGYSLIEVYPVEKDSFGIGTEPLESYAIHPLVHQWCLDCFWDDVNDEMSSVARCAVGFVMHESIRKTPLEWPLRRRLLPHCLRINFILKRQMRENKDTAVSISNYNALHNIGNHLDDLGMTKDAMVSLQHAAEGKERLLGKEDLSTLDAVYRFAICLRKNRNFDAAEELFRQVLSGRTQRLSALHQSTLDVMVSLGNLFTAKGNYEEAETFNMRALQGYKQTIGPDDERTLFVMQNIGNLQLRQGKLLKSEEMSREAFVGLKKVLGQDHIDTLLSMGNLAATYRKQGKLDEAEKLLQEAIAGQKKVLGEDHADTLLSIRSLAITHREQGKL